MIIEGLFEFHTGMNSDFELHESRIYVDKDYVKYLIQQVGEAYAAIKLHVLVKTELHPIIPEQVRMNRIEDDLLKLNGKKVKITIEEITSS